MHHLGGFFAKPRPFLPATSSPPSAGTGLVHMSPDHGETISHVCAEEQGIDPVFAVEADGKYRSDWAWLGGQGSVINTKFTAPDGPICSDLREAGALLAASDFRHSYPHSWRSKAKVIYRCTPQWFIAMDRALSGRTSTSLGTNGDEGGSQNSFVPSEVEGRTLRQTALQAIADTRFVPDKGRKRIGSMVEGRPDWVISRQRAWGVPIALFVERSSGQLLAERQSPHRRGDQGEASMLGTTTAPPFSAPTAIRTISSAVTDILDVWFDSGCTHVFTLESGAGPSQLARRPLSRRLGPASRLVPVVACWKAAALAAGALQAVLTHGFTMDSKGMKMSKSLGNTSTRST
jgi:isoleucyl-tRNA synthetase